MSKLKLSLPKVGLRNLKTALGVFICILLYDLFQRPYEFFACISVVTCLNTTMESSYRMGRDRMIGTILGGALGIPFLHFNNWATDMVDFFALEAIIIGLGVVFVIYIFNLIGMNGAIIAACIVFLSVLINLEDSLQFASPFRYSMDRIIDSAVGIIVALIVNKYFFPFDGEESQ